MSRRRKAVNFYDANAAYDRIHGPAKVYSKPLDPGQRARPPKLHTPSRKGYRYQPIPDGYFVGTQLQWPSRPEYRTIPPWESVPGDPPVPHAFRRVPDVRSLLPREFWLRDTDRGGDLVGAGRREIPRGDHGRGRGAESWHDDGVRQVGAPAARVHLDRGRPDPPRPDAGPLTQRAFPFLTESPR